MNKTTGRVGAFWVLPGSKVIGEACTLSEAECDDDYCNGPTGHDTLWRKLTKPASLSGRAYMSVPRGRVLYCIRESRFAVLAASEIVKDPAARRAVESFYNLPGSQLRSSWVVDSHYVTQPDLVDEDVDFV